MVSPAPLVFAVLNSVMQHRQNLHSGKSHKMLHGRLVEVVKVGKTVTDLQIFGCELHQNAVGGRAPPGPHGEL